MPEPPAPACVGRCCARPPIGCPASPPRRSSRSPMRASFGWWVSNRVLRMSSTDVLVHGNGWSVPRRSGSAPKTFGADHRFPCHTRWLAQSTCHASSIEPSAVARAPTREKPERDLSLRSGLASLPRPTGLPAHSTLPRGQSAGSTRRTRQRVVTCAARQSKGIAMMAKRHVAVVAGFQNARDAYSRVREARHRWAPSPIAGS